ncbi:hypothetical protein [Aquidulcibacter sp.]|uniref:hypothetical protein n=1 Tax=Aquidulcibacter sp. TaxID=2052990 RepID=UPI0025C44BF0|nr:hypothetical protein [Aquidulcibacter sp.]MCA3691765.1 hypothetical protein [Aquidulcibacter sp.]
MKLTIPEDNILARRIYTPNMGENGKWRFEEIFHFSTPKFPPELRRHESVDWVEIATAQGVHASGFEAARAKSAKGNATQYWGFWQAVNFEIHRIVGNCGSRFIVEHEPSEGPAHSHIVMIEAAAATNGSRRALKERLIDIFFRQQVAASHP